MLQMLCLVPRLRLKNLATICSIYLNTKKLKERVNYSTRFFRGGDEGERKKLSAFFHVLKTLLAAATPTPGVKLMLPSSARATSREAIQLRISRSLTNPK